MDPKRLSSKRRAFTRSRGAKAFDEYDGYVPVVIGGDTVNTKKCGTYTVTYDAVDPWGNAAKLSRNA